MVTITFPDRDTERRALGRMQGRFTGEALSDGRHLVPEAALDVLAEEGIPFTVNGTGSEAEHFAALKAKLQRGAAQAERGELVDAQEVFDEIREMSRRRREGGA